MKYWKLFGLFVINLMYTTSHSEEQLGNHNVSGILNSLFRNYDERLRPKFGGDVTEVIIGINIMDISSINEMSMDFVVDMYFRQYWVDSRLAYNLSRTLALSDSVVRSIWIPDTYFENAKVASFHKVTKDNKMMELVWPMGLVKYNSRVTVKASCPMDLHMFPMDHQMCELNIESYGYNVHQLKYVWEDNGIQFSQSVLQMPQFQFQHFKTKRKTTKYSAGVWSTLSIKFTMQRRLGFYIIQVYAPCSLVVILSWMTFLILPEQTAARVALGITSVLTMVTLLSSANNTMPKVAYVKALDWYIIICFVFVFGAVIEYTIVLLRICHQAKGLIDRVVMQEKLEKDSSSLQTLEVILEKRHYACFEVFSDLVSCVPNCFFVTDSHDEEKAKCHLQNEVENIESENERIARIFRTTREFLMASENGIDRCSRYVFPLLFLIFNLLYWTLCISNSS